MEQTYLKRGLLAFGLWLAMMFAVTILSGTASTIVLLLAVVILTVMLGKAIITSLSEVTGFNFFFSLWTVYFFYVVVAAFSVFIAPIYAVWMLTKYALAKRSQAHGEQ